MTDSSVVLLCSLLVLALALLALIMGRNERAMCSRERDDIRISSALLQEKADEIQLSEQRLLRIQEHVSRGVELLARGCDPGRHSGSDSYQECDNRNLH